MKDKKTYFKIALPDNPERCFVEPVGNMIGLLNSLVDDAKESAEPQSYLITVVFLTQGEFTALPEFDGF